MTSGNEPESGGIGIAIVGMSCRFAGAENFRAFCENLFAGVDSISRCSEEELEAWFDDDTRRSQEFVKARAILQNAGYFDAGFFGMQPLEAALTDPQHRVFIECAWEALEDAGHDPAQYKGHI